MAKRMLTVLLSCALLTVCRLATAQDAARGACAYDRARLLALNETQFDQDMSGGWRALASRPGCNLAAADLLRDYREAHGIQAGLLYWHEAQLRAFEGQSQQAIALMERTRNPEQEDHMGWNPYVDATIAFLRKDKSALDNARSKLLAVKPPVGKDVPPVIDGYMEVDMIDGTKAKLQWPQNIDVVDGLVHCFDKPYSEAYSNACRPRAGR